MANDVVVRLARLSEHQSLEDLQRRASLENPDDRQALLAHPDAIRLPVEQITSGRVFVVERGARIVGFAALVPRDDGDVELDALFVEPSEWRRGYGQALTDRCEHVARQTGAGAIHVIANPHAEQFYRACGFERYGTAEMQFGIGYLMRKPLQPKGRRRESSG